MLLVPLANATAHQHVHTLVYYANVHFALTLAKEYTQAEIRAVLREIRSMLVAGTFPY